MFGSVTPTAYPEGEEAVGRGVEHRGDEQGKEVGRLVTGQAVQRQEQHGIGQCACHTDDSEPHQLADHAQRRVEAGGVADREKLFGVGAIAAAAHLLGDGEVEVESAIGGAALAVSAFPGDQCLGGVESAHADSFRSDACRASVS
ncbi:Uncharacterised protein [Mycobacteroides abscessus]|nr:Uncharacterised protein [Mycobacteroides abscessus]